MPNFFSTKQCKKLEKVAHTATFFCFVALLLTLATGLAGCSDPQKSNNQQTNNQQTNNQQTNNQDSNKNTNVQPKKHVSTKTTAARTDQNQNKIASEHVFLTNHFQSSDSEKSHSFGCEDKIYLVVQFDHHQPKLHQIDVSWKDPNGEQREHNQFPYFVSGEQVFAWSALKLHRSVGAGMLQWINPAAGMEEFIGEWSVEVKIKDLIKKKINFEVLC